MRNWMRCLAGGGSEARLRALVRNDLAALAAIEGRFDEALAGWRAALEIDPDCLMARLNRDLIEAELSFGQMSGDVGELKLAPAPVPSPLVGEGGPQGRMGGGSRLGRRVARAELYWPTPPGPPFTRGGKFACGGAGFGAGLGLRIARTSNT